ncbi:very short patch repair endonuclease [Streptomyces sp. AC627_RSS907]|uniref:very short patch repair endonuclease n=1 Tax=Streptomyces sp. AC627_RSS907 TaxID=2823684 RepID=UPI0020B84ACD|nr:very short patch repair endonuclease [Streptomyces sp. AC627_RSS907]
MPQIGVGGHWKDRLPPERAYKRRAGAAAPAIEQDRAAGGRNRRNVDLGDGRLARASITLRLYRSTRRIRAYLRWSNDGRTEERYVCEVESDSRKQNLAEAWRQARVKGLLAEEKLPPESTASSLDVRASMRGNRSKNTKPELLLRSLLYRRGMRYRVDIRPIADVRRRADLVFPGDRIAVFVDGCFWHGCPDHYRPAMKNADFWREKINSNKARDAETNATLAAAGWTVIRVWEHDDPARAAAQIENAVRRKRGSAHLVATADAH